MSLKDLKGDDERRRREREERDRGFERKVTTQRFLKHNVPLIVAHLANGGGMGEVLSSEALRDDVHAARAAAVQLHALLTGVPASSVRLEDVRQLRNETVRMVAARRRQGLPTDPAGLVASLTSILDMPTPADRADDIDWRAITDGGSMSLTGVTATLGLWNATEAYTFRMDRDVVLSRLTATAVSVAARGVALISAGGASPEDRRALFQSLLRDVTSLLRTRYEAVARVTIERVNAMPSRRREAFFLERDPFGAMLTEFEADATVFLEHAARTVATVAGALDDAPRNAPEGQ